MQKIAVFGDMFLDIVSDKPIDIQFKDEASLIETSFIDKVGGSAVHCGHYLKKFGLKPLVVGRVGDDLAGSQIERSLSIRYIDHCILRDKKYSTGRCVIFWNSQEQRTILVHKENANRFVCENEASTFYGAVDDSDAVFLSGYCLKEPETRRYQFFRDVLRYAVKRGKFVMLDLVPHDVWRILPVSDFKEIIHETDLLISEVTTIRRFLNLPNVVLSQVEVEETASAVNKFSPRLSLILRFGENGCENEYIYNSLNSRQPLYHKTDFEHAVEKRGYGDLLTARALLRNFGFTPEGGGNKSN